MYCCVYSNVGSIGVIDVFDHHMGFRLDNMPVGYWYHWEIRLGCGQGQAAILSQAPLHYPSAIGLAIKVKKVLLDSSRTCLYSSFAILISSCNSINLCAYTRSLWTSAATHFNLHFRLRLMGRKAAVTYPLRAISWLRKFVDEMLDVFRSSYDVGDEGFNCSCKLLMSSLIVMSEHLASLSSSTLLDVSTTQSTNPSILWFPKCPKTHHKPLYSTRLAALGVDRVVGIDMEVCSNWVRLVMYSIDVEVIVNS